MLKAALDRKVRLFLKTIFDKTDGNDKTKDACFIIGVSGGADSMSLLNSLSKQRKAFGYELLAVHINHMLRGEEADGDEEFVRTFCGERNIPFKSFHIRVSEMADAEGLSFEEAGRRARYECFAECAKEHGAEGIFVAHNRDDATETVLFNLLRGASMSGLAGIRSVSEQNGIKIYRPLLNFGRDEIEAYLREEGLSWRTDSTNLGTDYSRNRIRLVLMPELEKLNPGAKKHLLRLSNEAAETEEYLSEQTMKAKEECFDSEKGALDAKKFAVLPVVIQKKLAHMLISEAAGKKKDIAEIHVNDFCALSLRENGKSISLPYGLTAEKKNNHIFIVKNDRG